MAQSAVEGPFPIFKTAGRYLLFDINVISFIRREHHICGVLVGNIPQAAQQTVFSGIPMELMPEEAKWLVDHGKAFIADDVKNHQQMLTGLDTRMLQEYSAMLERDGLEAAEIQKSYLDEKKKAYLKKVGSTEDGQQTEVVQPMQVTPTSSYPPLRLQERPQPNQIEVPKSYPVFAHLHANGYFMGPGLRFGCQYVAYPGDPLRYHSHFLVTGQEWDEEIDLLDIVGGGRLGTGVKKGYMVGGAPCNGTNEDEHVRVFSFEWAAM